MRTLILSTIIATFLACGGIGLGVPGEDAGADSQPIAVPGDAVCEAIALRQSPTVTCGYELPAGECGALTVYVDGELQPAHLLKVFCFEGIVLVPSDAHGLCPPREVLLCDDRHD